MPLRRMVCYNYEYRLAESRKMTTATIVQDIKSLVGSSASKPEQVPKVGERAPAIADINLSQSPHLVAFVRHCGCPFAEQEVRQLASVQKQHANIRVVIVAHSKQDVVQDWFERIGKPHFASLDKVTVKADPDYTIYNAFGIGQLGWTELFTRDTLSQVKQLASKGIANTATGEGSNRWLNSGGFAIDQGSIVRWAKVAKEASDVCNYEEAVKTIL